MVVKLLLKIAMLQEELHREQEELKALNGSEAAAIVGADERALNNLSSDNY